jgi:hypothetical protein
MLKERLSDPEGVEREDKDLQRGVPMYYWQSTGWYSTQDGGTGQFCGDLRNKEKNMVCTI